VIRAELGLTPTGVTLDVPEGDFCAVALPGGWYVVLTNLDERFSGDELLSKLSKGGEAVGCFLEEHVMMISAGWRDGRIEWSISHESEQGLDDLGLVGTRPSQLDALESAARANRAAQPQGPDYFFDVPVDLAGALTGFNHNEDFTFEQLAPAAPPAKKSWWARMMGS
jgi:hypothetical protein